MLSYSSFGIFASSLTENQIIAAILSFSGLLLFYIINLLGFGRVGILKSLYNELSTLRHSDNFTKGIITGIDVYYFVGSAVFFLLINLILLSFLTSFWTIFFVLSVEPSLTTIISFTG